MPDQSPQILPMFIQVPMVGTASGNALLARHITHAQIAAALGHAVLSTDGPTWFELHTALDAAGVAHTFDTVQAVITAMLQAGVPVKGEPLPENASFAPPSPEQIVVLGSAVGLSISLEQAQTIITSIGTAPQQSE